MFPGYYELVKSTNPIQTIEQVYTTVRMEIMIHIESVILLIDKDKSIEEAWQEYMDLSTKQYIYLNKWVQKLQFEIQEEYKGADEWFINSLLIFNSIDEAHKLFRELWSKRQ